MLGFSLCVCVWGGAAVLICMLKNGGEQKMQFYNQLLEQLSFIYWIN